MLSSSVPFSVILLFASQSITESSPELGPPLLLKRPLQVGGGVHELAQFVETFRDVVCGQRFQQDQDGCIPVGSPIEKSKMGEIQFVAAPIRADKVLREDEYSPPAALHGTHDVVHNPVSREEVSFVEAQGQRLGVSGVRSIVIILPEGLKTRKQVIFPTG